MPYAADQIVYLVVDSFGANGTVYRETEVERTDLETIIADRISGQFNDPVRVVAFNTLEHGSNDVSADIAAEIRTRCDIDREPVPEHEGFCGAACSLNPAACPSLGLMPRCRKPRSTVGHQSPDFVAQALATLIENAPYSERWLRFIFAAIAIIGIVVVPAS